MLSQLLELCKPEPQADERKPVSRKEKLQNQRRQKFVKAPGDRPGSGRPKFSAKRRPSSGKRAQDYSRQLLDQMSQLHPQRVADIQREVRDERRTKRQYSMLKKPPPTGSQWRIRGKIAERTRDNILSKARKK